MNSTKYGRRQVLQAVNKYNQWPMRSVRRLPAFDADAKTLHQPSAVCGSPAADCSALAVLLRPAQCNLRGME